MKMFKAIALAAAVVCSASFDAQALLITPSTPALAKGNQTSQASINAIITPLLGSATLLYKQNVGGSETGSLAASYKTTFANSTTSPEDALIKYVSGAIVGSAYLLVKGGSGSPAWYLFDLSTKWNGVEDLVLNDFWVGPGSISHLALYGSQVQFTPATASVPEAGTTLALLGLGLSALGIVRRKTNAKTNA